MDREFDGLGVVVTGGSGALGTAVVTRLLESGGRVVVPVYKPEELKRFPHTRHERVKIVESVDLADESSVEKFYKEASAYTPLWASIHTAGGFAMTPATGTGKAELMLMMNTNAVTCFLCCREAIKAMRSPTATRSTQHAARTTSGGGRIVNVAARPGLIPELGAGMVAYTASKAAVAAITQALAAEVASEGILVNAVVPSIMDTHSNRQAMPKADFSKWPKVEEVAATICFLASPLNTATRGGLVPAYGKS